MNLIGECRKARNVRKFQSILGRNNKFKQFNEKIWEWVAESLRIILWWGKALNRDQSQVVDAMKTKICRHWNMSKGTERYVFEIEKTRKIGKLWIGDKRGRKSCHVHQKYRMVENREMMCEMKLKSIWKGIKNYNCSIFKLQLW